MKPKFQITVILIFSLLAHYFVLNFFGIDYGQDLKAVVINSEVKGKGLYRRAEVIVTINRRYNGKIKSEQRILSTWDKLIKDLKPGQEYILKTHSNWLVAYKISSL